VYVVIVGGGRIGRFIAHDMVDKGHEVTVLERVQGRCEQLVAETGILVIEGDACDIEYLEQAHADRADVFVATTHEDDENLVSCQLALTACGAKRAISRVNTPNNVEIFEKLGIEAVSSTRLISELIESELVMEELVRLTNLRGGRLGLVEVRIPRDGDAPRPRRVDELFLPQEAIIAAVFRGPIAIIPRGDTVIEPGDEVVAIISPDVEDRLTAALLDRR